MVCRMVLQKCDVITYIFLKQLKTNPKTQLLLKYLCHLKEVAIKKYIFVIQHLQTIILKRCSYINVTYFIEVRSPTTKHCYHNYYKDKYYKMKNKISKENMLYADKNPLIFSTKVEHYSHCANKCYKKTGNLVRGTKSSTRHANCGCTIRIRNLLQDFIILLYETEKKINSVTR